MFEFKIATTAVAGVHYTKINAENESNGSKVPALISITILAPKCTTMDPVITQYPATLYYHVRQLEDILEAPKWTETNCDAHDPHQIEFKSIGKGGDKVIATPGGVTVDGETLSLSHRRPTMD